MIEGPPTRSSVGHPREFGYAEAAFIASAEKSTELHILENVRLFSFFVKQTQPNKTNKQIVCAKINQEFDFP